MGGKPTAQNRPPEVSRRLVAVAVVVDVAAAFERGRTQMD
jgi:hypothetical protein